MKQTCFFANLSSPASMPVEIRCLTAQSSYGVTQDTALIQLGIDACDAAEKAQLAHGDEKARLLDLSQHLRERELVGWMATKTEQMPYGDLLGASLAAMGIGNVHLLRHDIELAREWYMRAEALCPTNDDAGAVKQRNNIKTNKLQLDKFEAMRFLHKSVMVHGLVMKPQYNGRRGTALDLHESGRYEVLLDAVKSEIGSYYEFCAVHLLVHADNLKVV